MSVLFAFAPLSQTIRPWPTQLLGEPGSLFDEIGVTDFKLVQDDDAALKFSGTLAWLEEIELKVPGLDSVSLALLSTSGFTQLPFELTLAPDFKFALTNLNATLRIRTSFLRRVKQQQGGQWAPDLDTGGKARPVEIELNGVTATATAEGGVSISSAGMGLSLSPFEIGATGLVVNATDIGLHLNANDPPPPGAHAGFKGVSIDTASLHLTGSLAGGGTPNKIELENVLIGSSGFSGHIEAEWTGGAGKCQLFGMPCELISLAMDFRQNAPTGGGIKARVELPFFDGPVDVEIGYTADGGLIVGLDSSDGLATLSIPNVLDLELDALKFTVDDGVFTVGLSGMIIPRLQALKVPPIRVDNLTIDSKGNVNLPGGWLELPSQYALDFHSFKISITKFGLGRDPDGRKWIGFSGGIKLVDGLPAGVAVDGLRISCKEDWSDPKVSLQGVGVELEIKDVLYFKGAVAFRDLGIDGKRFDGSIKLELKSLKFKLDGEFVVGNTQTYRYMALYIAVDLPTGLPVLSTGLAVFGMEGLFALRMAPNKLPAERWYEIGSGGWYKKGGVVGVLPFSSKWSNVPVGKAFGAGLTFGTLSDNGYTISARALFVGIFPGPIFMIQGAANLLKDRAKLGEDPLFRSLAVYDGKAGTLLVGLDVSYKYDSTGKLIKLSAGTEAYYEFADPKAWRINLGLKTPTEQRIQARLFSMFDANAYLMLNARQVAMGCWVGYDKKWQFGPLKVALSAWMESNVVVSFKPMQFYGDMALHGGVELSAFGFGFSLTVDARVEAEIFHPKHLLAELDVTLNLPAPLPKKKRRLTAHCRIEYGPTPDKPPIPVALKGVSIEHMKVSTTWPLPPGAPDHLLKPIYDDGQGFLTSPSGNIDTLPANIPVVSMDCRPSLHFTRNVHDEALIGAAGQLPDPEWEWIGDPEKKQGSARVRYGLTSVVLDKWTGTAWTAVAGKGEGVSGLPELFGTWAPAAAASGPGVAQNRLILWSKCGFDSFRNAGSDYADWFAGEYGGPSGYPCVTAPSRSELCLDFQKLPLGPVDVPFRHPDHPGVIFDSPTRGKLEIKAVTPQGDRALCSTERQGVDIIFADGADRVQVRTVYFANQNAATVTAEDRDGRALEIATLPPTMVGGRIYAQNSRIHHGRVDRVHVRKAWWGGCLVEVCGMLGPGVAQLAAASQALGRNQSATALWSDAGTVLEPHTIYRLRVATRMQVAEFAYDEDGSFNVSHNPVQAAFFRTEGPPGLTRLSKPLEPPNASVDSALEDLGLYVAQTVPPTVPPRGQPPVLPRPVYRAYDVGVVFNEDYVDLLYRLAGRDLALVLYDRNNRPVRGRNGAVAMADNPWGVTETLSLTDMENKWLALIAANDCVPNVDEAQIPKKLTLAAPAEVLAPDTLYQARLVPLLLHEDFGRIESGTGRWHPHDFTAAGGASTWSIGHVGPAANLMQTGATGASMGAVANFGTAAVLGADPRAPAENPALWTDYRVSAKLRADSGAAIGLAFRWLGAQDFYLFAMDQRTGKGRTLYRLKAGAAAVLAQDSVLFAHQRDYELVVETIGGAISIWVDGELVFDVVDPAPLGAGSIALHCSGSPAAIFSDVRVLDLSTAAKSVYGFGFTTSRFVNLHHHVHSHDDDAWPGLCTLPPTDFATALSESVATPVMPVTDGEARAFDSIADHVLGTRARQDPVRFETYRIESATGEALALLVRSPEPFDPSRLSLALLHAAEDAPASIAPGAVKLIGAVLGAASPVDEHVTLLVRDAADLTGWRLQLRDPAIGAAAPLDDPQGLWETIFEFGAEDRMADATLIRIHSGSAAAGPPESGRRLERFRAAANQPGDVKLVGDRVDLRLVDRAGRVEHARRFLKDPLYGPTGVRLLRKADGTALILLPAGGPTARLPNGALRLSLVYRRDNRIAMPSSAVLAEGGDRSPEAVTIDIPTHGPRSSSQ